MLIQKMRLFKFTMTDFHAVLQIPELMLKHFELPVLESQAQIFRVFQVLLQLMIASAMVLMMTVIVKLMKNTKRQLPLAVLVNASQQERLIVLLVLKAIHAIQAHLLLMTHYVMV